LQQATPSKALKLPQERRFRQDFSRDAKTCIARKINKLATDEENPSGLKSVRLREFAVRPSMGKLSKKRKMHFGFREFPG
jgi:hypothetical protein